VALAWVRQQPEVTSTIIGTRTVDQLDANLAYLQLTIPGPQLAELDLATWPQLDFPADLLHNKAPSTSRPAPPSTESSPPNSAANTPSASAVLTAGRASRR
jgi:hypothetical protein